MKEGDWRRPLIEQFKEEYEERLERCRRLSAEAAHYLYVQHMCGNKQYIPVANVERELRIKPGGLLTLYRWRGSLILREGCEVGRWPDGSYGIRHKHGDWHLMATLTALQGLPPWRMRG